MNSLIKDTHQRLKTGKISCENLIAEKLNLLRKNEFNTSNFIIEDLSLAMAKKVDEKIRNGETINLLEGIPFGIKDVFMLQGYPATGSSEFLKNYISPYTATAIQKLIEQGAIPIVKENCDCFGHGSTSENTAFGAVLNAHDKSLVAGGSSGGSCVDVAKGITCFSIGGDTGGSIRQPAGYNRVFGFKPTYGRVSRYGIMAYASSTDCVGPICSTLEDIRIVLNAISGKDAHDQTTFFSNPISEFSKNFHYNTITLGYYKDFLHNEGISKNIKNDFEKLLQQLELLKIKVVALSFGEAEQLVPTYYALAMAETASNLARLDGSLYGKRIEAESLKETSALTRSENFTTETKRRIIGGNQVLSQGYADEIYNKALSLRSAITNNFENDFKKVDLILSPVSPDTAPKIGDSLQNPMAMYLSDIYTIGFSLSHLPTLALPIDTATGVQLTANKMQDELVLKFANLLIEKLS